jgi:hypothetical protein
MAEVTLDELEAVIERAVKTYSKQPRLKMDSEQFFGSVLKWLKVSELECPDYQADSRRRDAWLQANWQREPLWAAVINTSTLIDSSRGWTLTGGRNQVYRYTNILHASDQGKGWRNFFRREALSYRVTDLGSVTELGRDGKGGPLRAIYHVDSARCRWTGKLKTPLEYDPPQGNRQEWSEDDFFSVVSMPSDNEAFNGLGLCATSRALEVIKLLYGVWQHDQEQVGARMPKGLLLLRNIGEQQWKDAMTARTASLDAQDRYYYGGVMVLAGTGADEPDAKLVALSQLPANFDQVTFAQLVAQVYATTSGLDLREIWSITGGNLGTSTESEVQHEKASTKGSLEFTHAYQEKLQGELPDTLEFQFEERDEQGRLLQAQVAEAWAIVAKTLYEAGQMGGGPLLDREEVRSLLVDWGVIPDDWTAEEEEAQATDEEETRMRRLRERALATGTVQRAARLFPDEPVIRYHWPTGRELVLWQSGADVFRKRTWPTAISRQAGRDEGAILYEGDGVVITEADVTNAIEAGKARVGGEFAQLLEARPE